MDKQEIKKAIKSILIGWGILTFLFAVIYLGITFPILGILMILLFVFCMLSAIMIALGSTM